jgi:class 3 adenylate cyclase/tetratricopeptide (TPR) repeat protein
MQVCPVCGEENPERARFCLNCGSSLSAAPETRREERKIVTVLFADLVGFTSRAEQLDPEDVRAVLGPYWERLRVELERRGGTVEKFIGDAVMALFGAPVAHEDDPERAVRAALAIRDWAREQGDVQVRIAVTTGEALVLLGARPGEGEGMAAGDVVNTAARLQSSAPVNGVLVGESTYRATRDVIDYEEREPVVAKGKSEPIPVWEPLQAKSRFGMDLEQRSLMPIVGRVRELEALFGAFDRARAALEPQLVTVVGVPGIGKSRLVAELFQRVGDMPELVWWRQGRALPYGDGVSFWALSEMVKAQAGIQENDTPEAAHDRLRESVTAVVEGIDDQAWVMQHLVPLIGGPPPEGDNPNEKLAAWRRYFEGLAEQHPLVLVFEDLHWADEGLLDFIDHIVDWSSGVPIFVVGTTRPELLDRRPGWGGGKLNSTTLALQPLPDADAALIIHQVLEQSLLPADTQQVLVERAGGNPLYAEQFARLYVERGSAEDLPLPETIQGIIAARLDGLSGDEKRLLLDAAVLGKVFWSGAAASLAELDAPAAEGALHSLERKGILRRERRSAVTGEDEYAFRHVLVRDVAYGQIPRGERGEKHLKAAAWVEGLGRADDHADLVAHHYRAALDLGAAGGSVDPEVQQGARAAFVRAGERSMRLSAYAAAVTYYTEALALPGSQVDDARIHFAVAHARFHGEADMNGMLEARDLLETVGLVESAAEASALAANAAWTSGRGELAEEIVAHALQLVHGREPSAAVVEVLAEKARLDAFLGNLDAAETVCLRAMELVEPLGLDDLHASVLNTYAVIKLQRGDLRAARPHLEHALEIATGSTTRIRTATNLGVTWFLDGFHGQAKKHGVMANELARRMGEKSWEWWVHTAEIQQGLFGEGLWDEALTQSALVLAETQAVGGHYMEPSLQILRAFIFAARGEDDAARLEAERAVAGANPKGGIQAVAPILNHAAQVHLLLGDRERAHELIASLIGTLRESGTRAPGIEADGAATFWRTDFADDWLAIAEGFAETGRVWAANLVISGRAADAVAIYEQIGTPHEAASAAWVAAEQLVGEGRIAEAQPFLEAALAFYRAVGATRVIAQADALFAAAS